MWIVTRDARNCPVREKFDLFEQNEMPMEFVAAQAGPLTATWIRIDRE